jgi:hypothetical protein
VYGIADHPQRVFKTTACGFERVRCCFQSFIDVGQVERDLKIGFI